MLLGLRLAWKVGRFLLLAIVVYLLVTGAQVWMASRRDGARPSQAIVVFGAAQYNGRPSPVLEARLDHAAGLYRAGLAKRIVVTGGRRAGDRFTEASASASYLHGHGVPDEAIIREVDSTNSWQALAASAGILKERGLRQVILVSDPFHSARVGAMARELGLDARVSPTRTSPIAGTGQVPYFAKETVAVAVGRVIGFRRLMRVDTTVTRVRSGVRSR